MYKYKGFSVGNNITCAMYWKYRIAVNTVHDRNTPCLNYTRIIDNALHEGDNE